MAPALLLAAVLAAAPGGATVSGKVMIGGIRPTGEAMWLTRHADCPALIPDDRIVSRPDGSLKDAVVLLWPAGGRGPVPRSRPDPTLLAPRCGLAPRVQVARPGSLLLLERERGAEHRLHAYREGKTLWSEGEQAARPQRLSGEGAIDLRCDAGHEWELAWIYVTEAPLAAVSDAAGRFVLEDVPAGEYRMVVWHAWLGSVQVPIEVDAQRERGLVVALSGRGKVDVLYPGDFVEVKP